jgi:hypothetical protein
MDYYLLIGRQATRDAWRVPRTIELARSLASRASEKRQYVVFYHTLRGSTADADREDSEGPTLISRYSGGDEATTVKRAEYRPVGLMRHAVVGLVAGLSTMPLLSLACKEQPADRHQPPLINRERQKGDRAVRSWFSRRKEGQREKEPDTYRIGFGGENPTAAPPTTPATRAATKYVEDRGGRPDILGIEKDPRALRRAIDSGRVVEVTEDTWVTLSTNEWDSQEQYSDWADAVVKLGYRETLFIRRFDPDLRQGVPMLFAGTRRNVAGEERYVAACYYEEHRTVYLWATGREWKEPPGTPGPGVVTCDFFIQSVPEEHPHWSVAQGPTHGRTRIFSLPTDVAKELFGKQGRKE